MMVVERNTMWIIVISQKLGTSKSIISMTNDDATLCQPFPGNSWMSMTKNESNCMIQLLTLT